MKHFKLFREWGLNSILIHVLSSCPESFEILAIDTQEKWSQMGMLD